MTPETALKHQIKDYLKIKQKFWWYNLQGLGSYPGIPDLMVLDNGILYVIECKSKHGRMTEGQKEFMGRSHNAGAVVILARVLEDVMNIIK